MALCIWSFMCAKCDALVLLCTKCLRGRRYCDTCAAVARRCSVREAGRRYQRSAKGRRAHRRRSQRYRAAAWSGSRRQRQPPGVQLMGPSVGAPRASLGATTVAAPPTPPAVAPEAGHVPESAAAPCVTHQSRGPLPAAAARIALMATVACKTSEVRDGERRAPACGRPAPGGEVTPPPGDAPVRAQCSCCGRLGELVRFDGRPVIVYGAAPGDAAEEV